MGRILKEGRAFVNSIFCNVYIRLPVAPLMDAEANFSAMKKVNLYITHAQLRKLKKVSADTEIPMATIMRTGLDLALKKYRKKVR